ncbi:pyruvate, phosphate dikinase [Anaerococcus degeneri]|uniref:Pyruvate, phosphate dikinase n=1 Tax=Anaerococcus degeneri TaxID=361500 RepID=A0ABS7YZV2_9FIRM|nr:pyruvate, phosphate dikinase [Anaerococcus degeneri]MBP2014786.1 pyruvate,orthophosphate dikinase [Anaerococcus degeneri]MCA2096995.1 pyruvate, phosphate dikinase [Anaerococcus degeneri]
MSTKYVYNFDEGNKTMRDLLGGKGANLAEMTNMGINVPYGFSVTTEACIRYYKEDKKLWDALNEEITNHIKDLEKHNGKTFGNNEDPLLVSVRSGAPISMPGMMDTILNLGLNDIAVKGLENKTNNKRFAYDSYRRFIQMFADVAMGLDKNKFEEVLTAKKEEKGVSTDHDLVAEDFVDVVEKYKVVYKELAGEEFPQDPRKQLDLAISAVFSSWNNPRAILYRKLNDIDDKMGTAVNVQTMVFGNMGETSGTGVAFSRNPATGENVLYGEYLMNAQGEDVVAGVRTPEPISHLHELMPEVYDEFYNTAQTLEKHYKDMQDMEFTIQEGKLYLLQTRNGKRTAQAAVQVAVDMVEEGLVDEKEALLRVNPQDLDGLLHPTFTQEAVKKAQALTKGLAASPGAAVGKIAFSAPEAARRAKDGETVILVREETSPEDLEGMVSAVGILTARGGMTSHAAVVARGMGKCCVSGAQDIHVNELEHTLRVGDIVLTSEDTISIDGSTGEIFAGALATQPPQMHGAFGKFMEWVDEYRDMKVRTNADTPRDAKQALEFGAEGIGLCRTEHMFFADDRIFQVRKMILAADVETRQAALDKILPMQEEDFYQIYKLMEERPVTVRLLDPPLHEFLPKGEKEIADLALELKIQPARVHERISELQEVNPMLGFRGLRLGVIYPEISRMQARAIMQAAIRLNNEGVKVVPEIMIPLSSDVHELAYVKDIVVKEIEKVFEEQGMEIKYLLGTMIEIPRAAITADEIAQITDFFSFGTNDLTQMTFGLSRDDAGKFLPAYIEKDILEKDPFQVLDQKGVGFLVETAVEKGRKSNPALHLGICGEHGGEPNTVKYLYNVGLDYVSCSPFRIPIAKLAAAQAAIEKNK